MVDHGRDEILKQRREERSKLVLITFPKAKEGNYKIFNVVDEKGNFKYDGFVHGAIPHKDDSCKCKSFENNNNSLINGLYSDTHGFAFQCKHIIAARDQANAEIEKLSELSTSKSFEEVGASIEPIKGNPEQEMIQRDLLL